MAHFEKIRFTAGAALIGLLLLAGCSNKQQDALNKAKAQATATNTPLAIQYIDNNGNSVTTIVHPATAAGQPQQISTTTTPPPPGTRPHSTDPVVTPLGFGPNGQPVDTQPSNAPSANMAPTELQPANTASANVAPGPVPSPGTNPPAPSTNRPPPINLTVPAGTEVAIRIDQNISVKHSRAGDRFTGEFADPVIHNGIRIIPRGTRVRGRIDVAHRRGHFKGRSILELRLVSLSLNGYNYDIDTHDNVSTKKGKGKRTAGFIGGLTGAGMLIGGIASGGVGLAVGAAAGAGTGTLFAGATGNRDIDIPSESVVHFRLADRLVVQNP